MGCILNLRSAWRFALAVCVVALAAPIPSRISASSDAPGMHAQTLDGDALLSGDTYAARTYPLRNYGVARWLTVSSSPRSHAYVKFDLGPWSGQSITGAVLRLQLDDAAGAGIRVYRIADTWTESGLTWSNRPLGGSLVATRMSRSPAGSLTIDVKKAFPGRVVDRPTLALRIATSSTNGFRFSSRDGPVSPSLSLVLTTPSPSPSPSPSPTPTQVPNVCPSSDGPRFYFFGRGTDHGAGLSQYGARGRANAGQTYDQILGFYYTGIDFSTIDGSRPIRVRLTDSFWPTTTRPARVTALVGGWHSAAFPNLSFAQGSYVEMWPPTSPTPTPSPSPSPTPTPDPCAAASSAALSAFLSDYPGAAPNLSPPASTPPPMLVPPGHWVVVAYGADGTPLATSTSPDLLVEPDDADGILHMAYRDEHSGYREYRGQMRLLVTSTGLQTVNVLPLETYLRGVVPSEMPASWPLEAIKAQAVAARTYAWARLKDTGTWDIRPTSANQVYLGRQHERAASDQALAETQNQILTYDGRVISTVYHSAAGGYTENSEYAFPSSTGNPGNVVAYLRGRPDVDQSGVAYDSTAHSFSWQGAEFTMDQLSYIFSRNPQTDVGAIYSIVFSRGVSGRVYRAVLEGSEGSKTVSGGRFKNIYNANRLSGRELLSTMFYLTPVGPAGP